MAPIDPPRVLPFVPLTPGVHGDLQGAHEPTVGAWSLRLDAPALSSGQHRTRDSCRQETTRDRGLSVDPPHRVLRASGPDDPLGLPTRGQPQLERTTHNLIGRTETGRPPDCRHHHERPSREMMQQLGPLSSGTAIIATCRGELPAIVLEANYR